MSEELEKAKLGMMQAADRLMSRVESMLRRLEPALDAFAEQLAKEIEEDKNRRKAQR